MRGGGHYAIGEPTSFIRRSAEVGRAKREDMTNKGVILALIRLFVKKPDRLMAFQQLVPQVFDSYLVMAPSCARTCAHTQRGRHRRIHCRAHRHRRRARATAFFWSEAGMKLFGGHPDVQDPLKLKELLEVALKQQPIIVSAFLDQATRRDDDGGLPPLVKTCLTALLDYVAAGGRAAR